MTTGDQVVLVTPATYLGVRILPNLRVGSIGIVGGDPDAEFAFIRWAGGNLIAIDILCVRVLDVPDLTDAGQVLSWLASDGPAAP